MPNLTLPCSRDALTRHRRLQAAVLVVTLLTAMDQTIVATALPAIVRDVGGRAAMGWVFAGYTLAMTLAMPVYGRLGDLRGRRSLFLVCLVAFVGSSVACALATDMAQLVGLRGVQGLAGGGVHVLSQAVVADAVPARDRGRFMAPVGLVFATASVAGPLVGGVLTDTLGWRWVFWANLPLGAAAIALAVRSVPAPAPSATAATRRLDLAGALIPLGVLRNRTVLVASWLGLTIGISTFALVGFLPTIVQTVLGVPATASGALLLALIAGMMTSVFGTAWWISRTGRYRRLPVVGSLLAAIAMAGLSQLDRTWSLWHTAGWVALLGVGIGCFMQLVTTVAQDAVPGEHVGSATSTVSLVRELGVTIGAATIGAVLAAGSDPEALLLVLAGTLLVGAAVALLLPHRHLSEAASDHRAR